MKILIIDNYDSFTFNLYQQVGSILSANQIDFDLKVVRNDAASLADLETFSADKVIISPGPGHPEDPSYFGISKTIITNWVDVPILGVCLGMQGMVSALGGKLKLAPALFHGKTSLLQHQQSGLFKNLPNPLEIMRYHSIVADIDSFPSVFDITATLKEDNSMIMGIQHKSRPLHGVQFHPESFASQGGNTLMENFLWL